MTGTEDPDSARLCPQCGRAESLDPEGHVWPAGWVCKRCGYVLSSANGISLLAPGLADTVAGFDPASFAALAGLEETHYWFVPRSRLILGLLQRYFPDARSFLEVGCGNGVVLAEISRSRAWSRLVGAELHPQGLATARARLGISAELVQMDIRNIPAAAAFEVVGAFDALEHVDEDDHALGQIRRVLRAGGGVIITVPQHPWLWSRADDVAYHRRRYQRGELERKLVRAGFEVLFSSSYTALLLPLMLANRLLASVSSTMRAGQAAIDREFHVSPSLNWTLMTVLEGEVALTLAGVSWPCGGSRVVVARKR